MNLDEKLTPMTRSELGSAGAGLTLLTNYYKVNFSRPDHNDESFKQYRVDICYAGPGYRNMFNNAEKNTRRKILNKIQQTDGSELNGKDFAYDGSRALFTLGSLSQSSQFNFEVALEVTSNRNSGNQINAARTLEKYKVVIKLVSSFSLHSNAENSRKAIMGLHIILRHHAAKLGSLCVGRYLFPNDDRRLSATSSGLFTAMGQYASFRTTQTGVYVNLDVRTTLVLPCSVLNFLAFHEKTEVLGPKIEREKAETILNNLKIETSHSPIEYRISGLTDQTCKDQMFVLEKGGDKEDISVFEYYTKRKNIPLTNSENFPCIIVGQPHRPIYLPIELCSLPFKRYTEDLSYYRQKSFVTQSIFSPQQRKAHLSDALRCIDYPSESMLRRHGFSISSDLTQVRGRCLPAPQLMFGNFDFFTPTNGKWSFHKKTFVQARKLSNWAVVVFSASDNGDFSASKIDPPSFVTDLIEFGKSKGMEIDEPLHTHREKPYSTSRTPERRVMHMFNIIDKHHTELPSFLLCILPKKSDIYGPWKKECAVTSGIVTQCVLEVKDGKTAYLSSVIQKINAKLGGMNYQLKAEVYQSIPVISKAPTLILGMKVSHAPPGLSVPSVAAVISSRQWPVVSKYRANVQSQGSRSEMIENLFKLIDVTDLWDAKLRKKKDKGIIRKILKDFCASSNDQKPENIIIFRGGVADSMFNQVLNIELKQIRKACKHLDETWNPKFTVIVARKNHHTRFFQNNDNVPAGTVVDSTICHPKNYNFYMCAHTGMNGTSRPIHYHVLFDEIGFSANDLQELVHSLSYVNQRSTKATSLVAPLSYANLAAKQVRQFRRFEYGKFEAGQIEKRSRGESSLPSPVPELPKLHKRIRDSMFFV